MAAVVYVNQNDICRQFLAEIADREANGGEPYTIEEAIDWHDARTAPEFWRQSQLDRAIRRYKGRYLAMKFAKLQAAADRARQRIARRMAEKKTPSDRDERTASVEPRLHVKRKTAAGPKDVYPLQMTMNFGETRAAVDYHLQQQGHHAAEAVRLHDQFVDRCLEDGDPKEAARFRRIYARDPLFQQALSFVKSSEAM